MADNDFRNIKAILFDLDGTLMDTDDQAVEKIAGIFSRMHVTNPVGRAKRLVMAAETPVNWLIMMMDVIRLDNLLLPLWHKLRKQRSESLAGKTSLKHFRIIPGVPEMLASVKNTYRLGVVTTRGQDEAELFINENGLQGVFEVVVTRSSTRRLKPHPEPILFAAQQLELPVSKCLMVGDTTQDIKSARRAGALSVGVLCGFGMRKELERTRATVVLKHTALLSALLNQDADK
ncbi:MAG TPA: HAD family hydrolase [Bacteroidales bacterium]|nr:HAD family hydrolase [Bacteroidales bacterium]